MTVRRALVFLPLALAAAGASPSRAQSPAPPAIYLPYAELLATPELAFPDLASAEDLWRLMERMEDRHLGPRAFPGEAIGERAPTAGDVAVNLLAACHDFPDEPGGLFGKGAHRASCDGWMAAGRGQWHALRGWRAAHPLGGAEPAMAGAEAERSRAWAGAYLDALMDVDARFVYGLEALPAGQDSYRDTLAALWQNPARAIDLAVLMALLDQQGALSPQRRDRGLDLLGGIARAWAAAYRATDPGSVPNTGEPFTTSRAPDVAALSPLLGLPVAHAYDWTFRWDADKGNTQAEENAWQGAGVLLATRLLGDRMPDGPMVADGAKRFLDFAISYDRLEPATGRRIRSLNAEVSGGAYGQRPYWLENHTADVPSIPYLGATWSGLGIALPAAGEPGGAPWPGLVPDEAQWAAMTRSLDATTHGPDGRSLLDIERPGGVSYAMDAYPDWVMPCGQGLPGRHYVRYDGRAGPGPAYLSEAGQPLGLDLINLGPPVMRLAAWRGDAPVYEAWRRHLRRTLARYAQDPPDPAWSSCSIAPYVSKNLAFHATRMQAAFVMAYLGLRGVEVGPLE